MTEHFEPDEWDGDVQYNNERIMRKAAGDQWSDVMKAIHKASGKDSQCGNFTNR